MNDPRVAEALGELSLYLSDAVAPLVVADSVAILLGLPPSVVAQEILAWTTSQHRRLGASVPVSDYLYHAMRKLFMMGEFTLVPKEALAAYLESLKAYMIEFCPEEDRELLRENLGHLGDVRADLAAPVAGLHRLREEESAGAPVGPATAAKATVHAGRQLAELAQRLARVQLPSGGAAAAPAARSDMLAQLLLVAARRAGDGDEFQQIKEDLASAGMGVSMEEVFRSLGRRLPGWVLPAGPDAGAATPPTSTAQAMQKIVTLEQDPREAARRFQELVQAATEQVNEGSLPRAVTMLELAGTLLAEKKVDPAYVQAFREQAHEKIDQGRLRELVEEPATHALLQRVLAFFPALTAEGLLDALRTEEKRERRRLFLELLEVHGAPARAIAGTRLTESIASFGDRDAHYQRNLLHILRRIPRPDGQPADLELQTAIRLSAIGHPGMLAKEAITFLGQLKDERAERALVARVGEYETALLRPGGAGHDPTELVGVLDRTVFALARLGTPGAARAVVHHGLKRLPQLGDTGARLEALGGTDLSGDPEVVDQLVQAIRAELPHKIFGFLLKKDWSFLMHLVATVASTPSHAVRNVLADIVQRFPGEDFAKAAAQVLAGTEMPAQPAAPEPPQAASLSGDLELFGLPTLLQNLSQSATSGTLTITDPVGEEVAVILLEAGKLRGCRAAHLEDEIALFQLIERPTPASFAFVNKLDASVAGGSTPGRDLVPLFFEGTRRYDEFQQACALVPDYACLRGTGKKPTAPPEEDDQLLLRTVWQRASAGAPALECEAKLPVDSYRIRRMLAHWVEEGALEPR